MIIQAALMTVGVTAQGEGVMGDRFDSPGAVNRIRMRDDFVKGLDCFNSKDFAVPGNSVSITPPPDAYLARPPASAGPVQAT